MYEGQEPCCADNGEEPSSKQSQFVHDSLRNKSLDDVHLLDTIHKSCRIEVMSPVLSSQENATLADPIRSLRFRLERLGKSPKFGPTKSSDHENDIDISSEISEVSSRVLQNEQISSDIGLRLQFIHLQKDHCALWADFHGLESTLEELLSAYEDQIEITQKQQSDHRASDELREMEISRLRSSLKDSASHSALVETEKLQLLSENDQLKTHLAAIISERDCLFSEVQANKEKFQQLKAQAERKLKLAQEKVQTTFETCSSLERQNCALQREISTVNENFAACTHELNRTQAQAGEINDRIHALEKSVNDKEQESANAFILLTNAQRELQQSREQNHHLLEMNSRFKTGLVQASENIRGMKEKIASMENSAARHTDQDSKIRLLITENSNLKSRIFDSMETEKKLRRELEEGNFIIHPPIDESIFAEDPCHLRKQLEEKTVENTELLQISNELLQELEKIRANLPNT